MKLRTVTLIGGMLLLVIAGVAYWSPEGRGAKQSELLSDLSPSRAHIESLFAAHTPEAALALFKRENESRSVADQHTEAHIFGEVLYDTTGLKGFALCDGNFSFGCFHSFLGKAITDFGPDVVQKLDEQCVAVYGRYGTGCFHGIGHGLLSYYGYALKDVEAALSSCASLSWKGPISGCSDGVFMEYNFRVMEVNPSDRYRPFTAEEQYRPCESLGQYKEGCYFSLPAWWSNALPKETLLSSRLGELCADVDDTTLRRACYRGIGYGVVSQALVDIAEGKAFCDASAAGTARVWCREGLAWAAFANPDNRDQSADACSDGLSRAEARQCDAEYLFAIQ